jgi:hypothetical protein
VTGRKLPLQPTQPVNEPLSSSCRAVNAASRGGRTNHTCFDDPIVRLLLLESCLVCSRPDSSLVQQPTEADAFLKCARLVWAHFSLATLPIFASPFIIRRDLQHTKFFTCCRGASLSPSLCAVAALHFALTNFFTLRPSPPLQSSFSCRPHHHLPLTFYLTLPSQLVTTLSPLLS